MPGNVAHPGAKEAAAARRQRALTLRIAGNSYRKIAEALGVSHTLIEKDVMHELAQLAAVNQAKAAELRELEISRLDAATAAIAQQVSAGHHGAIDRWVRLSERRAKLLGLDAPQQTELSGPGGKPIEHDYRDSIFSKLFANPAAGGSAAPPEPVDAGGSGGAEL